MSSLSGILILMIVIAILIIVISIIVYNRRLDKITKGEIHDTHNPIPEPKTTANVLYKTILIVITAVSFISISTMSGMLMSLSNSVNNLENTQNSLNYELSSLRTMLEEQSGIIASSDWTLENTDYDAMTADIDYTVSLKTYSDDTEVTLYVNGNTIPLQKNAQTPGTYSGTFKAGFFDSLMNAKLVIKTAGISSTENTDLAESLAWDFFPFPAMSSHFNSNRQADGSIKYDGGYTLIFEDKNTYMNTQMPGIDKVTVTYLTSGRELKTMDITKEALSGEEITLEQGLDVDDYLAGRFEITLDNGYRLIDTTVMVFESGIDTQSLSGTYIIDPDGNKVWENPKY